MRETGAHRGEFFGISKAECKRLVTERHRYYYDQIRGSEHFFIGYTMVFDYEMH